MSIKVNVGVDVTTLEQKGPIMDRSKLVVGMSRMANEELRVNWDVTLARKVPGYFVTMSSKEYPNGVIGQLYKRYKVYVRTAEDAMAAEAAFREAFK